MRSPPTPTTRLMKVCLDCSGVGAGHGWSSACWAPQRGGVSSAPAGGWKVMMSPTLGSRAEAVAEAVDEHPLADVERRLHRPARDPVGLHEQPLDRQRDGQRHDHDDDQLGDLTAGEVLQSRSLALCFGHVQHGIIPAQRFVTNQRRSDAPAPEPALPSDEMRRIAPFVLLLAAAVVLVVAASATTRGRRRSGARRCCASSTATPSACASAAARSACATSASTRPSRSSPARRCSATPSAPRPPTRRSWPAAACAWWATSSSATATGACWPTSTASPTAPSSTPNWCATATRAPSRSRPTWRMRTSSPSSRGRPARSGRGLWRACAIG